MLSRKVFLYLVYQVVDQLLAPQRLPCMLAVSLAVVMEAVMAAYLKRPTNNEAYAMAAHTMQLHLRKIVPYYAG